MIYFKIAMVVFNLIVFGCSVILVWVATEVLKDNANNE